MRSTSGSRRAATFSRSACATAETALLKSGTEPFSGVSGYTPGSLRAVSMTDPQNFSALAPNADGFALITSQDGEVTAAESLRPSLGGLALKVLWTFLRYLALLLAAMLLVYGFIHLLGRATHDRSPS